MWRTGNERQSATNPCPALPLEQGRHPAPPRQQTFGATWSHNGRTDTDAVRHAAQTITARVADTTVRADLLASLGFFGKLPYPLLDAFGLIGRENMREATFFQEILAEGRAEGDLLRGRRDVLEALEVRFGAGANAEFREALDTITDAAELPALHRTAIKCRSIAGFRRALRARSTPTRQVQK
jgi:hypothetical protein